MYRLVVSRKFDAAHKIDGHMGRCRHIHGHSWKVDIAFSGQVLNDLGILYDFKDMKLLVDKILDVYDHSLIVREDKEGILRNQSSRIIELGCNPTAENLARIIYRDLKETLKTMKWIDVEWVRVWESDNAYAEFTE